MPAFRAKAGAEAHLRESGMEFVVLQPDAFMDVWFGMLIEGPIASGAPVTLIGESKGRHSFIAEADLAQFAVAVARRPEPVHMTLALGGPEAISFHDAAKAYERALGKPVPIRSIPVGASLPGLPEIVSGIAAAFENYDSVIPMSETSAAFGVTLTGVDDFARQRVAVGLGRG